MNNFNINVPDGIETSLSLRAQHILVSVNIWEITIKSVINLIYMTEQKPLTWVQINLLKLEHTLTLL